MRPRPAGRHTFGVTAALIGALALMAPVIASAVTPQKGAHFSGKTSVTPSGTVTFTVSSKGTALERFKFTTLGCLASPGATAFPVTVGKVKVSTTGSFSTSGAKAVLTKHPTSAITVTITLVVKVGGRFTGKKAASGTISFVQSVATNGAAGPKCSSPTVKFTAKA